MIKITIFFVILLVISPTFWILINNSKVIFNYKIKLINISDNIDEVNTLQGMLNSSGYGAIGRIAINKYSLLFKNLTSRYLESFDADFLFFKGDLNLLRSTRSQGALYLIYLPLIIYGIYNSKRKNILFISLIFSPIFTVMIFAHYDLVTRIPFLLVCIFIASLGLNSLMKNNNKVFIIVLFVLIFESTKFYEEFYYHYPRKVKQEIGVDITKD